MIKRAYIEITNVCNLNCSFCRKNHRRPEYMTADAFRYILTQVMDYTNYIYLHVQGEPLMHPQLEQILSECDRQKANVQLVTNGTFIKDHMNIAAHPCLRKVSFSLQSVEFQNPSFISAYLENILQFCQQASQRNAPYCELRFWRRELILMPATRYCLQTIYTRYELLKTSRVNSYEIMPNVYVDFDNEFDWPSFDGEVAGTEGTCHGAVNQFAILSNGNVVPCCLDADGMISFGNVKITPLKDILSSGRYQKMINSFLENHVREPFCQHCTYRRRFTKE